MVLDSLLYPLWLNADIPLCGGGAAVLQQPLHKGDIVTVILVNLRCVPLAEAVRADTVIAQMVTDKLKLPLYGSLCDGEYPGCAADLVTQAVILNILRYDERDSKHPALACFLFDDFKTVSLTVPNDVTGSEMYNIADTQAQITLQNKGSCYSLIGTATTKARFHGLYDFFVLIGG